MRCGFVLTGGDVERRLTIAAWVDGGRPVRRAALLARSSVGGHERQEE